MRSLLAFLARRRWAGVGLALLAELLILVALSFAPPSASVGIPAAVAAAIAGTIAVVFSVVEGAGLALAGATLFAGLGGWGAGEVAAIAVWPAIVGAVGLFARRVERHRLALRQLVADQEAERRSLAHTLQNDSAQALIGALLTLRAADGGRAEEAQHAREVINQTIQQLRQLALDLSPKALDDYGLSAALAHLADTESSRSGAAIALDSDWHGRLPEASEWALFRFAQAVLANVIGNGAHTATITLTSRPERTTLAVRADVADAPVLPAGLEERLSVLGGKIDIRRNERNEFVLAADVPTRLRAADPADRAA